MFKLKLPWASESRQKSISVGIEKMINSIKLQADKGEFEVYCDNLLGKDIVKFLEDRGYKVEEYDELMIWAYKGKGKIPTKKSHKVTW